MTKQDAINIRSARRKYLATPIESSLLDSIKTSMDNYNTQGNIRMEIALASNKQEGGYWQSESTIYGAHNFICLISNGVDKYNLERLGYWGEMLVLDLTTMGLGTCWIGSQQPKTNIPLSKTENIVCIIAFGYTRKRKSLKELLLHKLSHRKNKPMHELYTHSDKQPNWFLQGMEAVKKAPSSMNKQPVMFYYNENGYVTAISTNQSMPAALDLGIAKAHFELGVGSGTWTWGKNSTYSRGNL